ncbi:MAG TPA: IPT/TIG domain-containing protein [Longimicrobiales bacterium]|nr:IPT/TIG domain-containing protein [Longimicrobiales bacterium]
MKLTTMIATQPRRLLIACACVLFAAACGDGSTEPIDENAIPVLHSIEPDTVDAAAATFSLRILGEGFSRQSRIQLGGGNHQPTFVRPTELRLSLTQAELFAGGPARLYMNVENPAGGSNTRVLHVRYPVAGLTGVLPASIAWGDTTTELTVTGGGFTPASYVFISHNVQVVTTFVSPAKLEARIRSYGEAGGNASLIVANPDGSATPPIQLAILNPVAEITRFSPDSLLSDAEDRHIWIYGRRFVPGGQIRWNGSVRQGTITSDSTAWFEASASDLAPGLPAEITITNPAPGGATSQPATFTVRPAPPRITGADPAHATAGGADFTLTITGRNFSPQSVVHWNGVARPTTWLTQSSLRIDVAAADIATPGSRQFFVQDGDRASIAHAFPVLAPAATAAVTHVLPLQAHDLAHDHVRGLVYASVASDDPSYANRVVAIDAASGTITGSVLVGSDPGPLAITDDAQFLYVGLNEAPRVSRIDLDVFAIDVEIDFSADQQLGTVYAEDIVAIPGAPLTFAASLRVANSSPSHAGVVIYDDVTRRPVRTDGHTGANRITRGITPSEIYGFNTETTEHGVRRIGIFPDGLRELEVAGGLVETFYADLEFDGGLLFATTGSVIDAAPLSKRGMIPQSGAIWPEVSNGRVFVAHDDQVSVYHPAALVLIGAATHGRTGIHRVIRWGTDGLALAAADELVLMRGQLIGQ